MGSKTSITKKLGKLTSKQRKFVLEFVRNGNDATAAYKASYAAGDMKQQTIWRNSHTVKTRPKVAACIEALQEELDVEAMASVSLTREKVVKLILDVALTGEVEANRLKAMDMLGKISGVYETDHNQQRETPVVMVYSPGNAALPVGGVTPDGQKIISVMPEKDPSK